MCSPRSSSRRSMSRTGERAMTAMTHHALWSGVDLKLDIAAFHFERMAKALAPPERDAHRVAMGLEPITMWQRPFYAHLDAFLSASRSIPEILRCSFGLDRHPTVRPWLADLDPDEHARRRDFQDRFKPDYDAFRALP